LQDLTPYFLAYFLDPLLPHLQAKRFNCVEDASVAAKTWAEKGTFHRLKGIETVEHLGYEGKGRPKKDQKPTVIQYQIIAELNKTLLKLNVQRLKRRTTSLAVTRIRNSSATKQSFMPTRSNIKSNVDFGFSKTPYFSSLHYLSKRQSVSWHLHSASINFKLGIL